MDNNDDIPVLFSMDVLTRARAESLGLGHELHPEAAFLGILHTQSRKKRIPHVNFISVESLGEYISQMHPSVIKLDCEPDEDLDDIQEQLHHATYHALNPHDEQTKTVH